MGRSFLRLLLVVGIVAGASSAYCGTYYNIDNMSGWSSCGACAGINASGPVGTYWMKRVGSPSIDGSSAQFYVGGKSYADALWWKQLGANSAATHFTYDLYFYVQTPQLSQALEFDINQATGGHKYIFGTQCTPRYGHTWWVWDAVHGRWVNTYVACYPGAYNWNHLTIEVQRAGTQTHFIAITLNGRKSYINKYFGTKSSSGNELNVAFQMDLDSYGQGYSTWLDKVSLAY